MKLCSPYLDCLMCFDAVNSMFANMGPLRRLGLLQNDARHLISCNYLDSIS